jgi:hypothetical protein
MSRLTGRPGREDLKRTKSLAIPWPTLAYPVAPSSAARFLLTNLGLLELIRTEIPTAHAKAQLAQPSSKPTSAPRRKLIELIDPTTIVFSEVDVPLGDRALVQWDPSYTNHGLLSLSNFSTSASFSHLKLVVVDQASGARLSDLNFQRASSMPRFVLDASHLSDPHALLSFITPTLKAQLHQGSERSYFTPVEVLVRNDALVAHAKTHFDALAAQKTSTAYHFPCTFVTREGSGRRTDWIGQTVLDAATAIDTQAARRREDEQQRRLRDSDGDESESESESEGKGEGEDDSDYVDE